MNLVNAIQSSLQKIPPFKRIIVAVSGGADSVVLAYILKQLDYDIIIAHLNHQLRNESDADEQFVKKFAKEWGLSCVTKKATIPKTGNVENNARQIRYQFLEDIRQKRKADFIAVAHHLDDQIETILMHMARGAGLRGQIGMLYQTDKIIRPLLHVPRREIMKFAEKHNLPYRTDQSNFDLSNDRNYWRHLVIPYLKNKIKNYELGIKNIIPQSMSSNMRGTSPHSHIKKSALRREEKINLGKKIIAISQKAEKKLSILKPKAVNWLSIGYRNNQLDRIAFNRLSDDVKTEVLIQILGAKDFYSKTLNRLLNFIETGKTGKQMVVKNCSVIIQPTGILVRKCAPKTILPKRKITVKGINWGNWTIKKSGKTPLFVRQWKNGDRFQPNGMKGTKKLQDFFVDKKIPRAHRYQIPIIVDENNAIISVGNLRFDQRALNLKQYIMITPK